MMSGIFASIDSAHYAVIQSLTMSKHQFSDDKHFIQFRKQIYIHVKKDPQLSARTVTSIDLFS